MQQKIILSFFLLLIFLNTKAQSCTGGSSTSNVPTKCFEIESILVDACDGSNEGQNEMVRLRIGPNPIAVNSIGVAPYSNVAPNQTVNWGFGAPGGSSGNIFRGFANITSLPAISAKINLINISIIAAGNCGRLIPLNATSLAPAGCKLLIITSTAFNPTAQDFSKLSDTLYVIMQAAGNTGGHFANQANSGTRKLILYSGTCGDTVTYTPASLIQQDQTVGAEDGGAVNFTYSGTPTYVNYGCAVPIIPFNCDAGTTNPTYCNGTTVNLSGTVAGSSCYVWRTSNTASGTFADTTNLLTTFTITTGYVGPVKLYLFAKSNCGGKKDSVVFNATASTGVLNAGRDTSLCNSIAFNVNATSTATGSYAWTKSGAGTFNLSNILNPIYTPSILDVGIVNLILTQTTSCGVLKDTVKVNYTNKANASFTLSDSNFCYNNVPININVNPTVSGGVFTSSTGSFAANVFTFNAAGSFTIMYKIGTGSCSDSLTKPINASSHSNPNFTLSDTIVCKNASVVVLTPIVAGGVFSGTRVVANKFTPDTVGIFGLKYKITNGGCIDSLSKNIEVKARPDPLFISSKNIFCLNDASVILIPNTSGGIFSGTNVSGSVFTPNSVGVFPIKYIVSNAFCIHSSSQIFTVFNKPNPAFTLSDTLVCNGSPTITLTPMQVGGIFSGTNVSAQIFTPNTTGVFPVKYLISNANCADSAFKNIEVKPKPDATFTTTDSIFCVNDPKVTFTPTETGGVFTGTNVLGNQYNPITIGSFVVKHLISNGTCSDSSFKTMLVKAKPTADFTYIPANPYANDTVYFTFTGANATNYFWRFGDLNNSTSNLKDPFFEFPDANVYKTWLKVSNNEGCIDSIYKDISVLKKETIFIPNVFTPQNTDGLGLNDYFTIRSYGINNYHLQIYNRWGSLIFETNNINPGWDGTYNGDSCPDGVYFYIIDAIGFSKKIYHLHGTVTLLR